MGAAPRGRRRGRRFFFLVFASLNAARTGRYVRLGALTGACAALRIAAAVFFAVHFASVRPAESAG